MLWHMTGTVIATSSVVVAGRPRVTSFDCAVQNSSTHPGAFDFYIERPHAHPPADRADLSALLES